MSEHTYEHIKCEIDGSNMILTLNRPDKLNAYTSQMGSELEDAFNRADVDDNVRAVIVTATGRAFCAGADVSGGANSFDTSGAIPQPVAAAASSARSSRAASRRSPRSTAMRSASASP
jgi:enoyl-CoA hydratase/carnithine racemase